MPNLVAKSQNSSLSYKNLIKNLVEIKKILIKNKKTLSVAESCSGGYLSYLFTFLPGSSNFFKGSVVTYNDEIKKEVLNVNENHLKNYGAVSEEVSFDMANNVIKKFSTDYGISITGNLGPNPSENKEIGLIFVTILSNNSTLTKKFNIKGNREEIREKLTYNTIYLFNRFLKEDLEKNDR